jgi:hypothetical protein
MIACKYTDACAEMQFTGLRNNYTCQIFERKEILLAHEKK